MKYNKNISIQLNKYKNIFAFCLFNNIYFLC